MLLDQLEAELKKRVEAFPQLPWPKQRNNLDKLTNFVYRIPYWDDLLVRLERMGDEQKNYAINRWFNFWSAMGVEAIFCDLPGVEPHKNKYNRLVDFTIQGIPFDHKTTVFPARYDRSPDLAKINPGHLCAWLYQNQSKGQRYHVGNRLFIILLAEDGEHWTLRAELSALRYVIEAYVFNFDSVKLIRLGGSIFTDVIWFDRVIDEGRAMGAHAYFDVDEAEQLELF